MQAVAADIQLVKVVLVAAAEHIQRELPILVVSVEVVNLLHLQAPPTLEAAAVE
jgi:hypothetical protein